MGGRSHSGELDIKRAAPARSRFGARAIRRADLKAQPLRVSTFGCETFAGVEPQALGITYWFDPAEEGAPYAVTIRFTGHRIGVKGKPGPQDSFNQLDTVDVVPGSGPIAITARISDLAPGNWHVTAAPLLDARPRSARLGRVSTQSATLPKASTTGTTAFAPLIGVLAPGARLGVWPALVGLGAAVALATQALLATHIGLNETRVLLVSLIACVVGLIGAKLYYLTGHLMKGERPDFWSSLTGGMCIQGFVLGAVAALAVGAKVASLPIGLLLDVTAPGLLFGMTIGRFGCFFGGCCAGRPTGSRWGLWSSDRRLGMRRVPTQLLESAVALTIGVVALVAEWSQKPHPGGVVFVGAIAAYTFGRQLLFPLRAGPRHTAYGRIVALALAGVAVAVDIAVATLAR